MAAFLRRTAPSSPFRRVHHGAQIPKLRARYRNCGSSKRSSTVPHSIYSLPCLILKLNIYTMMFLTDMGSTQSDASRRHSSYTVRELVFDVWAILNAPLEERKRKRRGVAELAPPAKEGIEPARVQTAKVVQPRQVYQTAMGLVVRLRFVAWWPRCTFLSCRLQGSLWREQLRWTFLDEHASRLPAIRNFSGFLDSSANAVQLPPSIHLAHSSVFPSPDLSKVLRQLNSQVEDARQRYPTAKAERHMHPLDLKPSDNPKVVST